MSEEPSQPNLELISSKRIIEIETKLLTNAANIHTTNDVQKFLTTDEARDLLIESFKETAGNITAQIYLGCYYAHIVGLPLEDGINVLTDMYTMLEPEDRILIYKYGERHHPQTMDGEIERAVKGQLPSDPEGITNLQMELINLKTIPFAPVADKGIERGEMEDLANYLLNKLKNQTPKQGDLRAVLYYKGIYSESEWKKHLTAQQHNKLIERGKQVYEEMTAPF